VLVFHESVLQTCSITPCWTYLLLIASSAFLIKTFYLREMLFCDWFCWKGWEFSRGKKSCQYQQQLKSCQQNSNLVSKFCNLSRIKEGLQFCLGRAMRVTGGRQLAYFLLHISKRTQHLLATGAKSFGSIKFFFIERREIKSRSIALHICWRAKDSKAMARILMVQSILQHPLQLIFGNFYL